MPRRIGKQIAGEWQKSRFITQPALTFIKCITEIFLNLGILRITRLIVELCRHMHTMHPMPLRETHPHMLSLGVFIIAPLTALRRGTNADHVNRTVRWIVVGVP